MKNAVVRIATTAALTVVATIGGVGTASATAAGSVQALSFEEQARLAGLSAVEEFFIRAKVAHALAHTPGSVQTRFNQISWNHGKAMETFTAPGRHGKRPLDDGDCRYGWFCITDGSGGWASWEDCGNKHGVPDGFGRITYFINNQTPGTVAHIYWTDGGVYPSKAPQSSYTGTYKFDYVIVC